MNVYHCMVELKSGAQALAFAAAVQQWMTHLLDQGMIAKWRLMRRKFGLSSSNHCDFIIEIEVGGLTQLDQAFLSLAQSDDAAERLYDKMHQMIHRADIGLYRIFPDPAYRERIALI